jgi:hypothetical protein
VTLQQEDEEEEGERKSGFRDFGLRRKRVRGRRWKERGECAGGGLGESYWRKEEEILRFLVFGVGEKKKKVRERWREPGGPRGWGAGRQPGTDQLQFFKEK